jgi:hypothetical protein
VFDVLYDGWATPIIAPVGAEGKPQISGGLEDQESYWAFVSFVAAKGQIYVT